MSKVILRNITVKQSRVVNPVHKDWGPQYSMIISGDNAEKVGSVSGQEGEYWLNWNAQYPNGDPINPTPQVRGKGEAEPTELGDGSVVDLAFETTERRGKTYYNLRAIKILDFVQPKTVMDWFKEDDEVNEFDDVSKVF